MEHSSVTSKDVVVFVVIVLFVVSFLLGVSLSLTVAA